MRKDKVSVTWHAGKPDEKKGETDYVIYDNLTEAGDHLGSATALALLNVQVKTKAMNDFRKQWEPKEGKQVLRNKAMAMVTAQEWIAAAGDQARIEEVITKYVAQLENQGAAANGGATAAPNADAAQEEQDAQAQQDAGQG